MATLDASYRIERDELLLFVKTPRAAQWIARNVTNNVAETIHFERSRGEEVVRGMVADGLRVREDVSSI